MRVAIGLLKKYGLLALVSVSCLLIVVQFYHDKPDPSNVGLANFFLESPKDSLIAGYPDDMDRIPLLSKRRVLINKELSLPYYKNYYSEVKRRTLDFFSAYYSSDSEEVLAFCLKYGVDYLVVNKGHFDTKFINGKIYYSPFDEHARKVAKKNGLYVLNFIDDAKKVFSNEKFSVIKCNEQTFNTQGQDRSQHSHPRL